MDPFKNRFKPSHTTSNDKSVKNIDIFGLVKPSAGYLPYGHKNQDFDEYLQLKNNKLYPIHPSFGAPSFKLLGDINVDITQKYSRC